MRIEKIAQAAGGRVILLQKEGVPTQADLERLSSSATIFACDFYLQGAEYGSEVPGGYQCGRVINIDHHAPRERMQRVISSGVLAGDYVRACGLPGPDCDVFINHADCDSIVSSAIIRGLFSPSEVLDRAVIAADHTGEENIIADTLQPMDACRDPELSYRALRLLLEGRPLEPLMQEKLDSQREDRELARKLVAQGTFQDRGCGLFFGITPTRFDSAFLPALLPQAKLIVAAVPRPGGRHEFKLRLGPLAPAGFTLHDLHVGNFDENYGGRWNAGSDARAKDHEPFCTLSPERYVECLLQALGCS